MEPGAVNPKPRGRAPAPEDSAWSFPYDRDWAPGEPVPPLIRSGAKTYTNSDTLP